MSIIGRHKLVTIRNVQQFTAAAVSGQGLADLPVTENPRPEALTLAESATPDRDSGAQFTMVGNK